jgi:hypothetical protein
MIIEKLWLGDLWDARNTKKLVELGITHVLTVNEFSLDARSAEPFKYKFVVCVRTIHCLVLITYRRDFREAEMDPLSTRCAFLAD